MRIWAEAIRQDSVRHQPALMTLRVTNGYSRFTGGRGPGRAVGHHAQELAQSKVDRVKRFPAYIWRAWIVYR